MESIVSFDGFFCMPNFKINTFYALLLIIMSLLVLTGFDSSVTSFWEFVPILLVGFGVILLPITYSLKKKKDSARIASILITGFVGAISMMMLMKVQMVSRIVEPSLIFLTVLSFVVVGIYIGSLKRS